MTLETRSLALLHDALATLEAGLAHLPAFEPEVDCERIGEVLTAVAQRLQDNFPYPHPLYAGQMMKPPHPLARLAYTLSLWINPNNHALDGGRASSAMEKEAVAAIAAMFGWPRHLGHLCSGGTMANLEALWIAGQLHPGRTILASEQAHYTHRRLCDVLQLRFSTVAVDGRGKMDMQALEAAVQTHDVGTVVVTLGTTGLGALDPLPQVMALREQYGFRVHVDAAYGGYFTLVDDLDDARRAIYSALICADSIVIDPHKHGLQPYGCGCVLFNDPSVGRIYRHDSPYTYFSSDQLHLGEISLECSRPGAAAVALWATQRLLPLQQGGEFSLGLARSLRAADRLYRRLADNPDYLLLAPPELDILVWAPRAPSASTLSTRSRQVYRRAAESGLHLALIDLPSTLLKTHWPEVEFDQPAVTCLRSCLMKAEHLDWCDTIAGLLERLAIDTAGSRPE